MLQSLFPILYPFTFKIMTCMLKDLWIGNCVAQIDVFLSVLSVLMFILARREFSSRLSILRKDIRHRMLKGTL